jgi:hypothetical protein
MEIRMKRHIVRAGLGAAAAIAGAAGCQSKPPPQNVQSASAQPLTEPKTTHRAQPTTAPAPVAEASVGTAEALALKFQNYAKEIEPLMNQRMRKGSSGAERSDVDFLEPGEFRMGPPVMLNSKKPEPPVQVIPIANPLVETTPSLTNQGATIANAVEKPSATGGANAPNKLMADASTPRPAVISTGVRDASLSGGDLEASLARNLRDYPKDIWAQFDFQLLQFLKDKPVPQLDLLAKLTNEDRELLTAVMDGLANFRNAVRSDNNMLMSRKVRPILELADRVRAQADLIIPTLSLCTKVDGFGVYEPVEPARFTAMKEHPIIVYCEVENFSSHLNEKKMWETKLSQEVVLYTETGLPVWQDKTENIPDLARNRRHDFFVVKKTRFPGNITIGRYLLKVTIVDQQASRVAEATVPVVFVAQ